MSATPPVVLISPQKLRLPAVLGGLASALGLFFSAYSTHDYALHLDRQLHDTHCSFVPGLVDAGAGANACTAAMYSPYSALFRQTFWGGIPISLFALGAYTFFLVASAYLFWTGARASGRVWHGFGILAVSPLLVSLWMLFLSLTRVGALCKLCVGLYVASFVLAAAGVLAWRVAKALGIVAVARPSSPTDTIPNAAYYGHPAVESRSVPPGYPAPAYATEELPPAVVSARTGLAGSWRLVPWLVALGVFTAAPALVYASLLPDYTRFLLSCGKLLEKTEAHNALVKLPTTNAREPALLVVDPLCPTCKAFHQRLVSEGIFENLDVTVAIFPLDSECNWMIDRPLHPGACVLAKAFLCGDKAGQSRAILEWSYDNQDELKEAGKTGKELLRAKVRAQFPAVDKCIDEKDTSKRLDNLLHYAIANKLPISTPQFFLGDTRVCDEDTDLGLRFTLGKLAPGALR